MKDAILTEVPGNIQVRFVDEKSDDDTYLNCYNPFLDSVQSLRGKLFSKLHSIRQIGANKPTWLLYASGWFIPAYEKVKRFGCLLAKYRRMLYFATGFNHVNNLV